MFMLSENLIDHIFSSKLLIKILNSIEPRKDPSGPPLKTSQLGDDFIFEIHQFASLNQ